jgi:hypothetical protein
MFNQFTTPSCWVVICQHIYVYLKSYPPLKGHSSSLYLIYTPYIQMVLFCNLIITKINALKILIIDKYRYFGD